MYKLFESFVLLGVLLCFTCGKANAQVTGGAQVSLQEKTRNNVPWTGELKVKGKTLVAMTVSTGDTFEEDTGQVANAGNISNWVTPVNSPKEVLFRGTVRNADQDKTYGPRFRGVFLAEPGEGPGEETDLTWNVTTQNININSEHDYIDWNWVKDSSVEVIVNPKILPKKEILFPHPVGTVEEGKRLQGVVDAAIAALGHGKYDGVFEEDITVRIDFLSTGSFSDATCKWSSHQTCQFAQQRERKYKVTINLTGQIIVPKWNLSNIDKENLNPDAKTAWEKYEADVLKHEEGHQKIFEEVVETLKTSEFMEQFKRKIVAEACSGESKEKSRDKITQSFNNGIPQSEFESIIGATVMKMLNNEHSQYHAEGTNPIARPPNVPLHKDF